jgi:hypothetical protein
MSPVRISNCTNNIIDGAAAAGNGDTLFEARRLLRYPTTILLAQAQVATIFQRIPSPITGNCGLGHRHHQNTIFGTGSGSGTAAQLMELRVQD